MDEVESEESKNQANEEEKEESKSQNSFESDSFEDDEHFAGESIPTDIQQKRMEILLGLPITKNKAFLNMNTAEIMKNVGLLKNNNEVNEEVEVKEVKSFISRLIIPYDSKWK